MIEDYDGYNGWSNRETWATALHINNDQGLYELARDYTQTAWEEHTAVGENSVSWGEIIDNEAEAVACLADTLQNWIEDDLLTLENIAGNQGLFSMLSDIGSLYRVDWKEIASSFISEMLVKQMKTYIYLVEQVIAIKANSKEEAEGLLPIYPTGFEGQAYYVRDETVELLREEEEEGK